jgi:hypothetical protein
MQIPPTPTPKKYLSMLKIPWVQCSNIQFKVKFSVLVTVKVIFRGSVRVGVSENWVIILIQKKFDKLDSGCGRGAVSMHIPRQLWEIE